MTAIQSRAPVAQPPGQDALLTPAPDGAEKYGYIQRNLTFLTLTLVIGAACLIFSQLRFELTGGPRSGRSPWSPGSTSSTRRSACR